VLGRAWREHNRWPRTARSYTTPNCILRGCTQEAAATRAKGIFRLLQSTAHRLRPQADAPTPTRFPRSDTQEHPASLVTAAAPPPPLPMNAPHPAPLRPCPLVARFRLAASPHPRFSTQASSPLSSSVSQDKQYPRDWWLSRGRLRVQLFNADGTPTNPEVPTREPLRTISGAPRCGAGVCGPRACRACSVA
jgi:hypothetical protein